MNKNVVQPTLVQQEKFIQRTIECSLNGLLHYAATAKSTRRNVYSTLMKRLNCFGGENSASREFRINFSKVAVNEQKRKKYLELTVDLIKRRNDDSGAFELKEWALVLMQNIDHNIATCRCTTRAGRARRQGGVRHSARRPGRAL